MIKRYERQVMKDLWSDQKKFDTFLQVELAASYAWMKKGLISLDVYEKLSKATYQISDIESIEREVKHDVIAFTKAVALSLGEEKKWLHYGLTSTDVVDTAQSLILKEASQIILEDLEQFMSVVRSLSLRYQKVPCMGRTHGIHAEVTSFGLKFALWYEDLKRLKKGFIDAADEVSLIKMSGAVGTYAGSHPDIQKIAAKYLGLKESMIATQTLQRDRHAKFITQIALIGSELEKIAVEIRHLSRTEVGEVREYFNPYQKGSSAMPHKKNPISSENITGLSRVLRGYALTAFENIPLWHERDISHSSAERIILSDSTTLIDYMLNRYQDTLKHLEVDTVQMERNIHYTHGVVFAQGVLNHVIQQGLDRNVAYDIIQSLAMKSLQDRSSFKDALLKEEQLKPYIKASDLDPIFNPETYLKHVDAIYQNVFKV
jgi:adenylosuccinate lyase